MSAARPFVGRSGELAALRGAIRRAIDGQGDLILLAGEAGVGKTRCAREALNGGSLQLIEAFASPAITPPYGPLISILRWALGRDPLAVAGWGPLANHLAAILPELDTPPPRSDQPTLVAAIHDALTVMANGAPTAILLDDLQWADSATLDLLASMAGWAEGDALLIIGTYRDDGLALSHPLRRARAELRRQGRLHEVRLNPLTSEESAELVTGLLGREADGTVVNELIQRAQGIPFFVEELSESLRDSQFEPTSGTIPTTIHEAVLLRLSALSSATRAALDVAAVAGPSFDLDVVTELVAAPEAIDDALDTGIIREAGDGRAMFRHALVQECVYRTLSRTQRRAIHCQIAELLHSGGAPATEIAQHWLAANRRDSARSSFLKAADEACAQHAYRDAAESARKSLDLWPRDTADIERVTVFERYAECSFASGNAAEAARSWRESSELYRFHKDWPSLARVQRNLAGLFEMQGDGGAAVEARQAARQAFEACNAVEEAAAERLALAEHLEGMGRFADGLAALQGLQDIARERQRPDIEFRALALEGQLRADRGEVEAGLDMIRRGLGSALEANLVEVAADAYYRLANAMSLSTDYAATRNAYGEAISFCQTNDAPVMQLVCLGCLAVVLRQTGEWDRGTEICRAVIDDDGAPAAARVIATGMLGSFQVLRGERTRARALLNEAHERSMEIGIAALVIDSAWNLAKLDEQEGRPETAERYRFILEHWNRTEDRHYVVSPLGDAATFFARAGMEAEARTCARILLAIAAETGNAEALAGAATALAESALLMANVQQAVEHFDRSLSLLAPLEVPYERARVQLRAGVARAKLGDTPSAIGLLTDAYRTAQKLGARPLALEAAHELSELGETVDKRLGRRAARFLERGGLSPRELEVLGSVCQGHTSKEIAELLMLSPRTVEMYVSNVLSKLNCATRAEAAHKAHQLGIVTHAAGASLSTSPR